MPFKLTSTAFSQNGTIPVRFTCDGADVSPSLAWLGAPAGTKGFAIVCVDPDAPLGNFYHWALYDIPATVSELPEHHAVKSADDGQQGVNDFGRPDYNGPCPPRGGPHHYHFTLFALKLAKLPLTGVPGCREVERSAKEAALGRAELVGLYGR